MEGNPVSYLEPFGLEKVDTSGMHIAAGLIGAGAFVIGVLATGGSRLAIGAASSGFDAGLYINDAITADTPKEALKCCFKYRRNWCRCCL